MSWNGSESLSFETFTKFKQWKETLKTDRGLQFTFQWSRVQNGSQYWRYNCKHVRLTKTRPHQFAYMMVAIEVDGSVQVELNAPNVNEDLFGERSSPLKDVELSESEQSGETGADHDETAQTKEPESSSDETSPSAEPEANPDDTAQLEKPETNQDDSSNDSGHLGEPETNSTEMAQSGEPESNRDGTAQAENPEAEHEEKTERGDAGANQDGTGKPEESETSHEEAESENTTKDETEPSIATDSKPKQDAQDDTQSIRSVKKLRVEGSITHEDVDQTKPAVKHARPWESTPAESFGAALESSIELGVEPEPDIFLGKQKTQIQPEESNRRKKFRNSEETADEIVKFSKGTIERAPESDGTQQTR